MTVQPRMVGGRYEIGGILGYGGMAEVHRGRDTRLGRDVAIKMLRSDLARDQTFLTRFRREAQNAASLNHPSIVAVYDTGEDTSGPAPVPYIVMEYVEGRTLKELIQAEGRLTPRRACEIVADACAALDFSHRHQIIHRDVKPGNVMLATNGQVKVMDFGIARAMASGQATMTQTSAVIGTAQYLSPEQALGKTVDRRSDVYATGCLLYELLCGDPPFTGDSPVAVAYQHVREAPIPPSHVNPDVPPSVDAIVLKALAKNADNRYQSAGEMREDLERAIAGRPVLATPLMSDEDRTQLLGSVDDTTRAVPAAVQDEQPRGKGRVALVSVLVVALVAAIGFGGWYLAFGGKAVVPDVRNMEEAQAIDEIEDVGLKAEVEPVKSSPEQEGIVIGQSPLGDTRLDEGEIVTIQVGQGTGEVELPDLTQYSSFEAAKAALDELDLKAVEKKVKSGETEGKIVGQSPKAGESVQPGSTVTVEISDGTISPIPTLVGMDEEAARDLISREGFTVGNVVYVTEGGEVGKVISQDPEPETDGDQGQAINLTIVGVAVPNLVDKTIEDARALMEEAGLTLVVPPGAADDWVITSQDQDGIVKKDSEVSVEAEEPGLGD